jgi:hypothetical protein
MISLLTPTGVLIAAAIVTVVVELGKITLPGIYNTVNGRWQSLILSVVIYGTVTIGITPDNLEILTAVISACLLCAISAVGAYEVAVKPMEKRLSKPAIRTVIGANEKFDDE